jgi:hypothetical protein
VDVHDFELLSEFVPVDPITISQEILWCAVKGEGFDDLLCGPLRCRMDRHVELKDGSAVVSEYDKDKQGLEPDGVYGEEVDRNHLRDVICKKRLRRRFAMSHHVFGHRRLRDWNPELEKFAVDSGRSPQHVISTHGSDQFAGGLWNARSSGFSVANLPGPVPTETSTMPIDAYPASRSRVRIATETKIGTAKPINIGRLAQSWFGIRSLKDGDLVSKGENFQLNIGMSSEVHSERRQKRK